MTEKEIGRIAEEVLRRIKQAEASEKILFLYSSTEGEKEASVYFKSEKFSSYACCKALIRADGKVGECDNQSVQMIVKEYDALFVAGISLKQLTMIKRLQLDDTLSEIICEALIQGKQVYIACSWLNSINTSSLFGKKISSLRETLEKYGLVFLLESEDKCEKKKDEVNKSVNKTSKECFDGNRIQGRVIAKQDIVKLSGEQIEIRNDAVITSTAKALINKRHLTIVRTNF